MQLGVALVMCAAVSWFLRQPRVTLLASMFSLFNFIVVAPQLVYQPTAEARGRDTVRLVHVNINNYNREIESSLEFFRETDPDVLVIVEANERLMAALEPLQEPLPHVFVETRGRFGVALLSRYPMAAQAVYFTPHNPSIVAVIDTPYGPLRVVGTHPRSPASARRARRRNTQLDAIATFVRGGSEPTVLLGDLNTTPWGHAFRALVVESELRDTSRGVGFQWSWPASFWPLAIPIDHALVSEDVRVLDRRMGPSIGSDHLPLVLDIALAANLDR
jgi:endonuclease/exonuclease/phosphatase (EEP) superfamily protein YafD